jgi:hypothetical protein
MTETYFRFTDAKEAAARLERLYNRPGTVKAIIVWRS